MRLILFLTITLASSYSFADPSWDTRCRELERDVINSSKSTYVGNLGESPEVRELKNQVDVRAIANKVIVKIRENCAAKIYMRNPLNSPLEFVDNIYIDECEKLYYPNKSQPLTENSRIALRHCLDVSGNLFGFSLSQLDRGLKIGLLQSKNSESADCRDDAVSSSSRDFIKENFDPNSAKSKGIESATVTPQ